MFHVVVRISSSKALGNSGHPGQYAEQSCSYPALTHAYVTFRFAFSLRLLATRLMEARRADEAPAPATEAVAAFRHAATSANANHYAMAVELLELSRQLTANGRPAEAIAPPRAAADILRGPAAAPDASADVTWSFAYSLMTVATRLMEAHRADEATAPAAEAVIAFRHAATSAGANHQAIAGELLSLSRQLTANGRPAEAIAPPRAAADILRRPAAAPDASADVTWSFAYSLMTVATRLMEARRADEATAPAAEAVTAFRHAATTAGANHHAIASELLNLSRQLTANARPVEAIEPPRAAADILRGPAAAPEATADITFFFASSLMTVATRLMEARRADEATAPAAQAVTAFRRAATVTGANQRAIAGELLHLSRQLTANRRHVEAVDPAGAAVDVFRAVASLPDARADDRSLFACTPAPPGAATDRRRQEKRSTTAGRRSDRLLSSSRAGGPGDIRGAARGGGTPGGESQAGVDCRWRRRGSPLTTCSSNAAPARTCRDVRPAPRLPSPSPPRPSVLPASASTSPLRMPPFPCLPLRCSATTLENRSAGVCVW